MKRTLLAFAAVALLALGGLAISSESNTEKECPPVCKPSDCCSTVCPQ